jgi:hypothetical protein
MEKDKIIEKCGCYCHKQKPNGVVHDRLCCDKMNGSLMIYGVNQALATQKEEMRKDAIKLFKALKNEAELAGESVFLQETTRQLENLKSLEQL